MLDPEMEWDVFVSHASEDKASCVEPIAQALEQRGYAVWYDKFTLKLGDSLRQSIDRGLSRSRYGVVVLSKAFFRKRWPQAELDGLLEREVHGSKVILPVWHGIDAEEVLARSPLLAGKLAVSTSDGLDNVVQEIADVLGKPIRQKVADRIGGIDVSGTATDLQTLAKNLWWTAQNYPNQALVLKKLQAVLDELRGLEVTSSPPVHAPEIEEAFLPYRSPDRFEQFVAIGRSGRSVDVDFLMSALVRENDMATSKLVDYVLSLVRTSEGKNRVRWYLINGSQTQRNYAALYFKRKGERSVLEEAVRKGCIDRIQAFSS